LLLYGLLLYGLLLYGLLLYGFGVGAVPGNITPGDGLG
jgi:hypothetical protein